MKRFGSVVPLRYSILKRSVTPTAANVISISFTPLVKLARRGSGSIYSSTEGSAYARVSVYVEIGERSKVRL